MSNTTAAPNQTATETPVVPAYTPAKPGPNWIMIILLVVFGGPVLLVGGLVLCLVVIGAVGSSANASFNEVTAELNETSYQESVTETSVVKPSLDAPVSATQSDDDYDPFDI